MKWLRAFILLFSLAFAACDETALRMARETRDVLDAYERQLRLKVASETKAYLRQAQIEAEAAREQGYSNLEQERIERARGLALDVLDGRKDPRRWRDAVRDYARADYVVQRDLLLAGIDAESRFLEKIQALQIEKEKIAALREAFDALASKPGLTEQLKGLTEFAQQTTDDFHKRVCDSLTGQITAKEAGVKSASTDAAKKEAQTALDALNDLQKEKACSASADKKKEGS